MSYQEEVKRIMDLSFKAGAVVGFAAGFSTACGVAAIVIHFLK